MSKFEEFVDDEEARLAQRSEALREKDDFEALTVNPGWRRLSVWIDAQVHERTQQIILKPCTGIKDQLESEFSKGEISALILVKQIVKVGLETATAVARSLDDDRASDSPTDSDDSFS